MTITSDSRYVGTNEVFVQSDRGNVRTIYVPPINTQYPYKLYLAVEGITFDLLAVRLYSDPKLYWRIADLNPHVFFPGEIPPGTLIRIPAS